jgi:prepilin-type N-terminal cleavage/methylation domain-containing protein
VQNSLFHERWANLVRNKGLIRKKGFTIIEVVLVLAIAGLIFTMVFVALPALQRSQRDTQRRNDLSRAITAITNYTSNNRGALPDLSAANSSNFISKYLTAGGDTFVDPSGTNYQFANTAVGSNFDAANATISATVGAVCNGENLTTGQGARKVALQMKLEGGGVACANN